MDVQLCGGTTHCDTEGNLPNFGGIFILKNGLTTILTFELVHEKYSVSYDYTVDTFTIHTTEKDTHSHCSHHGLYCHDSTPGKSAISMVHKVKGNLEGFTNLQVTDSKKDLQAYDMVGHPPPCGFFLSIFNRPL